MDKERPCILFTQSILQSCHFYTRILFVYQSGNENINMYQTDVYFKF